MSSVLRPGMVRVISPVSGSATSRSRREVLPGDLPERLGTPYLEGVGVAELAVELGAAGDGLFEVEGVSDVEGGGAVGDAVVADLVQAEVDVAVVAGVAASFLGRFGVETDQGFVDEPVDLRPAAAVRIRSQLCVDERRGVLGQRRVWSAIRNAFHTGTSPSSTRAHSRREPVGQLDDLSDVVATGVQGPAQQGEELHHGKVGDQRCARVRRAGDRCPDPARTTSPQSASSANSVLGGPFGDLADGGDLLIGDDRAALLDAGEQLLRIASGRPGTPAAAAGAVRSKRGGCRIHEIYWIWNIRHNQTPRTRLWTGDPQQSRCGRKVVITSTSATTASTSDSAAPGKGRGDSAVTNGGGRPRPS